MERSRAWFVESRNHMAGMSPVMMKVSATPPTTSNLFTVVSAREDVRFSLTTCQNEKGKRKKEKEKSQTQSAREAILKHPRKLLVLHSQSKVTNDPFNDTAVEFAVNRVWATILGKKMKKNMREKKMKK